MKTTTVGAIVNRLLDRYSIETDVYKAGDDCMQALKDLKKLPKVKKIALATTQDYLIKLPDCAENGIRAVLDPGGPELSTRGIAFPGAGMHPWLISEDQYIYTSESYLSVEDIQAIGNARGSYMHYEEDLPYLKFNGNDKEVIVVYNGLSTLDNGLPVIPDSCFDYCVHYLLREEFRQRFLARKATLYELQEVEKWMKQAARKVRSIPASDNKRNEIFDVLTSFDRKHFGIPI